MMSWQNSLYFFGRNTRQAADARSKNQRSISDRVRFKSLVLPVLNLRTSLTRRVNVNIFVVAESFRFQFILFYNYFIFATHREKGKLQADATKLSRYISLIKVGALYFTTRFANVQ